MAEEDSRRPPYEDALRKILTRIEINKEDVEDIVGHYRKDHERFDSDYWGFYNYLVAMGLRPQQAQYVVNNFFAASHQGAFAMPTTNPMGSQMSQYPMIMTPYGPVPVTLPSANASGDEDEKEMRRTMRWIMMLRAASGGGSNQQQSWPMGYPPMMGNVSVEPMLGQDGKPIRDEMTGGILYRTHMLPFPGTVDAAGKGQTSSFLEQLALREREHGQALEQQYLELVKTFGEGRVNELIDKVQVLESRDPAQEFANQMDTLRKAGLLKEEGGSGITAEVKKMEIEYKREHDRSEDDWRRFKHEADEKWKRWQEEQKQRREETKQTMEQVRQVGDSIRDGIKHIGAPLAEAVGTGIKEGSKNRPPSPGTPSIDRMSEEEVQSQLKKAEEAEKVVGQAKAKLQERLKTLQTPQPPK